MLGKEILPKTRKNRRKSGLAKVEALLWFLVEGGPWKNPQSLSIGGLE